MKYNFNIKKNLYVQIKTKIYENIKPEYSQPQSPEIQQEILQAELDCVEENLEAVSYTHLGGGYEAVLFPFDNKSLETRRFFPLICFAGQ